MDPTAEINNLKGERAYLLKTNKSIVERAETEDRPLTTDELAIIGDNEKKAADCKSRYEGLEERLRVKTKIESQIAEPDRTDERHAPIPSPAAGSTFDRDRPGDMAIRVLPRSRALKAFRGPDADRRAYRSGRWLAATFLGDTDSLRWCQNQGMHVDTRAMSIGTMSAGGVVVPTEFEQAVIDLRDDFGVFRRETRIYPMGSDKKQIGRKSARPTAYHTAEAAAITESQSGFEPVDLIADKVGVLVIMSSELNEDAYIDVADDLANDMAYALAYREDVDGFTGDGTPACGGTMGVSIKIADGNHAGSLVGAAAGHNLPSEIDSTDLASLMGKLPAYARPNAKFYCSPEYKDVIFGDILMNAGGNTMGDMSRGYVPRYNGHEIVESSLLPSTLTDMATALILLYGDLRLASAMGVRRGITLAISDQIKFIEDQIVLKATERYAINVHSLGGASTAGPIVGMTATA